MTSLLMLAFIAPASAVAAGCLADTREVDLGGGASARTAQYLCQFGDSPDDALRIEFHRLSDMAADVLLNGKDLGALEGVIGKPRLIRNEVGDEYASLLDQFGTTVEAEVVKFEMQAPKKGQTGESTSELGSRLFKRFSSNLNTAFQLALPGELELLLGSRAWPKNYNFFYYETSGDSPTNIAEAMTLWKYVTRKDIDDFDANWNEINRQFGEGPGELDNKYRMLAAHLTKEFWPPDFLIASGGIGEDCEPGLMFNVTSRPVLLEIATIENMSSSPVSVDQLLGATQSQRRLRPPLGGGAANAQIPANIELAPGEKIALPLKIAVFPPENDYLFERGVPANYQRLKNAPGGTVLTFKGVGERTFEKSTDSFKPPSKPSFKTYVYGPEIDLQGVEANGEPILFNERSANFLNMTGAIEGGSCPVLYAWREEAGTWARRGKVIDAANGRANAATERVDFEGFVTRFRLTEEEAELARIDRVALLLTTKDGREVWLEPDNRDLVEVDGREAKIAAGQMIEFAFAPPSDFAPGDIVKSSLVISGYYERYMSLPLMSQN